MTHGSVFSGIGGPEVAASMLGWENLFHCEINPFGRKILDYYYPNAESYEDITKTDFTKWRGRINVLTGGFPCQPFSYAGQRRGAKDDRYLWPYMFRCIDQIQPDWVVCENVAGILTMVEQGEVAPMASAPTLFDTADDVRGQFQLRETFTLERICNDLEGHGYEVQPILVPACAIGAPHRRDRVFIVGHRELATDTKGIGRFDGDRTERRAVAGRPDMAQAERSVDATIGNGGQGTAMHTEGECGGRMRLEQPEDSLSGTRLFGGADFADGCGGHTAYTGSEGLERSGRQGLQESQSRFDGAAYACRCFGDSRAERPESGSCGARWQGFPTVSPIHRGNDGIPFDVDNLTIPFGQWRTESLKAYGNAIVPQVMYEIFRAIEKVEEK